MEKSDFYYDLPDELIAQHPAAKRDNSRLLVLEGQTGNCQDLMFFDLPRLMREGDLLVMNDTRVMPARLIGRKEDSGIAVEFLLLHRIEGAPDEWEVLVHPGRRLRAGTRVNFIKGRLSATVLQTLPGGNRRVRFHYEGIWEELLDEAGEMPLPPYIHEQLQDRERYQTVYARQLGSAAAPTAGLHFTPELLRQLEEQGVELCYITLHVGLGTFRPVRESQIEDHVMHSEYFELSELAAEQLNRARKEKRRIVATGTTSCRVLESCLPAAGQVKAVSGWTDIFIYPGYQWKAVDCLITNFHLPESTLLMLVSSFAGKEAVMAAYDHAVEEKYRFFSFGDAMFISRRPYENEDAIDG